QVGGIIQKRLFTEGDMVKAGQALYQIDPSSYRATWNEAAAALSEAVVRPVSWLTTGTGWLCRVTTPTSGVGCCGADVCALS
uniref:biotin/lipoyl-binding protein n=1 Tax=Klebsiella pneumoniae TaxID=573 RepID=UPI001F5F458D